MEIYPKTYFSLLPKYILSFFTYWISHPHGGRFLLIRLSIQITTDATIEMVFMIIANSWIATEMDFFHYCCCTKKRNLQITGVAAADPKWAAIRLLNSWRAKNWSNKTKSLVKSWTLIFPMKGVKRKIIEQTHVGMASSILTAEEDLWRLIQKLSWETTEGSELMLGTVPDTLHP